ncbi:hypothetical protein MMC26_001054 [Xylographa opegraphella]|nr:hypothetical protein [Xylographa opegraphella]
MSSSVSHISELAFQITSGPLTGFVLLAAVARIAVQISNRRRLYLSDAFLMFACACLCAATGILYRLFDIFYLEQAAIVDPASVLLPSDFLDEAMYSLKLLFTVQTLIWTVVFSVKFSFLSFFRPLVSRLARLKIWWTIVVVFTVLTFAFCAADVFIICPHFDLSSLECANVAVTPKARSISIAVLVLDIITDVAIISIPIMLLWNAKIKPRQKSGLLVSLCLSISMIIVALIRTTLCPQLDQTQDVPYELFLFQLEGCIAVFMASVSAFRSLFASHGTRAVRPKPHFLWSSRHQLWNRGKSKLRAGTESGTNGLPSIPSATMTGLRTFINRDGSDGPGALEEKSSADWPLTARKQEGSYSPNPSSEIESV